MIKDMMSMSPKIVRFDEVARVIPLPLSQSSRSLLGNIKDRCVHLDNTKSDAVIMSIGGVLAIDSKAKSFAIIPQSGCMPEYMRYIINTVPVRNKINAYREKRSLSSIALSGQPIPMIPIETQQAILKIEEYSKMLETIKDYDINAELGIMCLQEISIGINTELFLNELCQENNISIIERWSRLVHNIPKHMIRELMPGVLLSTGNPLMAEVRALQRILMRAHKDTKDGL